MSLIDRIRDTFSNEPYPCPDWCDEVNEHRHALPEPAFTAIDYSVICGLPHDHTNDGIGQLITDEGNQRACENCEDIRDDYKQWLRSHGYRVAA